MDGALSDVNEPANVDPDFLHNREVNAVELPQLDTRGTERFFNRELSRLQFNWRVLEEAQNPRLPLLERVKMLSISGTDSSPTWHVM